MKRKELQTTDECGFCYRASEGLLQSRICPHCGTAKPTFEVKYSAPQLYERKEVPISMSVYRCVLSLMICASVLLSGCSISLCLVNCGDTIKAPAVVCYDSGKKVECPKE